MYSPTHRPATSVTNIASPNNRQPRRMSSPIPPPAPLNLPEAPSPHVAMQQSSSHSPLRNGITLDPATGTFSEDGSPDDNDDQEDPWGVRERDQMSLSQSPSITKFASSFAQRVGSLVSSVSPATTSGYLPTEAEIEAEAESQRERSRREAERILTQEAAERKNVEERVLEMLQASRARPTRSQTAPSPGDSPIATPSTRDGSGGWWSAAKNKLTPTKEVTPAQQIVLETKAREKEKRKSRDKEWPSKGSSKYTDPAYMSLSLPPGARPPGGMFGAGADVIPWSPTSPTPHSDRSARQLVASPTASPSKSPTHFPNHTRANSAQLYPTSPVLFTDPTAEPPPVYAQFSSEGVLNVSSTLLIIARRFEKLERWSVSHVRALEERMGDVEKWLVDKERERERDAVASKMSLGTQTDVPIIPEERNVQPVQQVVREVTIERKTVEVDREVKREVGEMKDELGELRDRVSELGREMTRLASSALNGISHTMSPSDTSGFGIGRIMSPGSTGPTTPVTPSPRTLPPIPTREEEDYSQSPSVHSIAPSESASIISTSTTTRTKLPYPTGDYTSPSPPGSPRPSVAQSVGNYTANNASSHISRTRPASYTGLPKTQISSTSENVPHSSATTGNYMSASPSLPPPSGPQPVSTSPTPRKRYTVALGQPLSSSPSTSLPATSLLKNEPPTPGSEKKTDLSEALFSETPNIELQTAFFSHVPRDVDKVVNSRSRQEMEEGETEEDMTREDVSLRRQETIGTTPITLSRLSLSPPPSQNNSPGNGSRDPSGLRRSSPRPSPSHLRVRPQSAYGVPGASASSVNSFIRHKRTPGPGSVSLSSNEREEEGEGKTASWRRSRSIDRVGLGIDSGPGGANFVDPLIIRKKTREKEREATDIRGAGLGSPGGPRGKVAFGDLLAFFDAERQ